ncbi:MAG: ATP phosphoribosyltransferase regulatory subunit [Parvibaculales bacterium]
MSDFNRLTTASDVIDALGGTKKMAELLGVGAAAVSNYRIKGFPASKYLHIDQLCTENGLNVADAVFGNQRGATDTQAEANEQAETGPYATIEESVNAAMSELLNEGFTQLPSFPILQPAAPFINRIGTEMQQRLYILTDPSGERLCLRPDLTIPSALYYLETDQTGEARYFYQGTTFRYQPHSSGTPEESMQIGLEIMGGTDEKADDAKILRHILNFIKNLGIDIKLCEMTMVDCRHFINRVDQYGFSEVVAADLKQRLNANISVNDLEEILKRFADNAPSNNITALPPEATDIVGRTGAEIGNRFEAKKRNAKIAQGDKKKLEKFRQELNKDSENMPQKFIHGRASPYEKNMRDTAINMGMPKENIFRRLTHMQKMGYYTSIYFEITTPNLGNDQPMARGGRYDDLLQSLGAKNPIPAVGGAIALERLLKAAMTK